MDEMDERRLREQQEDRIADYTPAEPVRFPPCTGCGNDDPDQYDRLPLATGIRCKQCGRERRTP